MSFIFSFNSLIFLYIIPITFSQGPPPTPSAPPAPLAPTAPPAPGPKTSLGKSACSYYGRNPIECNFAVVTVDQLPKECTSFVYDGLNVNPKYEITDANNGTVEKFTTDLGTLGKPMFLFYGHLNGEEWNAIWKDNINNNGTSAKDEMNSLQTYLTKFKGISGLILKNIDFYNDTVEANQYENFIIYLKTMKSTFPDLAIGVNVAGSNLIYKCLDSMKCYDFNKIDSFIDFYVIDIINFNDCTNEFKCSTYPIDGEGYGTMGILAVAIEKRTILITKTFFYVRGSPRSSVDSICGTSYQALCTKPDNALDWCWNTQKSYSDIGNFARSNGAGFMIENIDLIDPLKECKCDRPFPAFYFLLDSYSGAPPPAKCPLFDGSCV